MTRVAGALAILLAAPWLAIGALLSPGAPAKVFPSTEAEEAPVSRLLAHPNLSFRAPAIRDLEAGLVDARVVGLLLVLAARHRLSWVGPFVSGHSYFVAGTNRPSNHAAGRAVDIPFVDGAAVSSGNPGALAALEEALALPPEVRPTEAGGPWAIERGGVWVVTRDHASHLHFGWHRRGP